jgi:hypothetical protein
MSDEVLMASPSKIACSCGGKYSAGDWPVFILEEEGGVAGLSHLPCPR